MLPFGGWHVNKQALHDLVYISLFEIQGVAKTVSTLTERISKLIDKGSLENGIAIECKDGSLVIKVRVALFENTTIFATCERIQEHIKKVIESMTGMTVTAIHVRVAQIKKTRPLASL